MTPNEKYDLEQARRRELRKANDAMRQRHAEREAADLANAQRDALGASVAVTLVWGLRALILSRRQAA